MHLFAGTAHPALARALARELKIPLGRITLKRFSCGECYVRFEESVRGQDVYILQTGGRDPDRDLLELFLMCQAAKLSFARAVHVILPHFPYARQDRVASPREPISAKLLSHLLETSGADHVITLNLHSDQIQGFFSIPVDALSATHLLADTIRRRKLGDVTVVAPDIGSAKDAKRFADTLGAPLAIVHKSRPAHQKVEVLNIVGEVRGRACVIFDDMIDTGGTIISAATALRGRGATNDIVVAAVHGIFSGDANKRLRATRFKEIIVTDTIPQSPWKGLTVIPVAPMLSEVVHHIERHESVTDIYRK